MGEAAGAAAAQAQPVPVPRLGPLGRRGRRRCRAGRQRQGIRGRRPRRGKHGRAARDRRRGRDRGAQVRSKVYSVFQGCMGVHGMASTAGWAARVRNPGVVFVVLGFWQGSDAQGHGSMHLLLSTFC